MSRIPASSGPPQESLRVLLLEDQAIDAELLIQALRRSGFVPESRRVETEAEFRAALDPTLDVIIADYVLPSWSGPAALEAVRQSGFDLPVIIVSGVVGDESAAAVIKQGAEDFLLKDRLIRLGDVVRRTLTETRLRRERSSAQAALRIAHTQMTRLLEHNPAVLYVRHGDTLHFTPGGPDDSVLRLLGFSATEAQAPGWWRDRLHPEDRESARLAVVASPHSGGGRSEYRLRHKAGHYCWIEDVRRPLQDASGHPAGLVGVWIDITERKRTEAERERLLAKLQAAQATIKTLTGILPICSSCKHVRDERGAWHQIETYIRDHSRADFTHGLCPDCVRLRHPDLAEAILAQTRKDLR